MEEALGVLLRLAYQFSHLPAVRASDRYRQREGRWYLPLPVADNPGQANDIPRAIDSPLRVEHHFVRLGIRSPPLVHVVDYPLAVIGLEVTEVAVLFGRDDP